MEDTMNKRPSFQFYPADWIKDTDLNMCSKITKGVWIDILCRMWEAQEEGKLSGTKEELCRVLGATIHELETFLLEARRHPFCDVLQNVTECDGEVTIINRRMNKAFKERERIKKAMRRNRKKSCDEKVTLYSSSSSSTTKEKESIKKKKFIPPTVEEIQKYLDEHPELNKLTAQQFFDDYAPKWIDTHGKPVRNWKLKLRTRNNYRNNRTHAHQGHTDNDEHPEPSEPFIR